MTNKELANQILTLCNSGAPILGPIILLLDRHRPEPRLDGPVVHFISVLAEDPALPADHAEKYAYNSVAIGDYVAAEQAIRHTDDLLASLNKLSPTMRAVNVIFRTPVVTLPPPPSAAPAPPAG